MTNPGGSDRLTELERRLAALESGGQQSSQSGQHGGAQQSGGQEGGPAAQVSPYDAAQVQAFLQGALAGASYAQSVPTSGGQQGAGVQFLSIFSCPSGGGWNPTRYDSFFWCKSRFVCNPQSLSCLC
jgi:hypothetical protein